MKRVTGQKKTVIVIVVPLTMCLMDPGLGLISIMYIILLNWEDFCYTFRWFRYKN